MKQRRFIVDDRLQMHRPAPECVDVFQSFAGVAHVELVETRGAERSREVGRPGAAAQVRAHQVDDRGDHEEDGDEAQDRRQHPLPLADPVIGVQRQYVTSQIRKGVDFVNNTFYSNKEVDDLFVAGAQELDSAKRAEIYHKIQKVLVIDQPVIWLGEVQYVTVFNKKLHDATTGPLGTYSAFERAWIEH